MQIKWDATHSKSSDCGFILGKGQKWNVGTQKIYSNDSCWNWQGNCILVNFYNIGTLSTFYLCIMPAQATANCCISKVLFIENGSYHYVGAPQNAFILVEAED